MKQHSYLVNVRAVHPLTQEQAYNANFYVLALDLDNAIARALHPWRGVPGVTVSATIHGRRRVHEQGYHEAYLTLPVPGAPKRRAAWAAMVARFDYILNQMTQVHHA
jgi:hypothetical protein